MRGYHNGPIVVGDSQAGLGLDCCLEASVGRPSWSGYRAVVERRRCQRVGLARTSCCPSERLRISRTLVRLTGAIADMGGELSIEETGWRGMIDVGESE